MASTLAITEIFIKRGLRADLPTLAPSVFGFCTDTGEVFIGSSSGNILVNRNIEAIIKEVLPNVDNTADVEKPVSEPQKAYIAIQDQTILTAATTFTNEQKVILEAEIRRVESIAHGASISVAFDTQQQLIDWVNGTYTHPEGLTPTDLKVGEMLLIRETGVPDYWWDGSRPIEAEGEKVDLSGYLTANQVEALILPVTEGLGGKEPMVSEGTTSQYYRGDKTWAEIAPAVRQTALNGLILTDDSAVTASDTIVAAVGKLQTQLDTIFNKVEIDGGEF